MNSLKKPLVTIVIPNWNGVDLLKNCLPTILNQVFKNYEVIIVDNGSKDGSIDFIKKNYPKFKIIELPKNIGFSPAVNLGIKKSLGKYIFLLNNDTKLDKNCLQELVSVIEEKKEVGMVAAKMLNLNNPKIIDSAGDYIDSVGHANNIGLGEKDTEKFNKEGFVFLVTGGGSMFKKNIFEKVGLFDEDYFAYMEDVDFCLRAQLLGIRAWYSPRAIIYHIHGATSRKNQSFKEYLQYRNMTMTVIKNFPKKLLLKDLNWLKIILVNINSIRFLWTKGYLKSALKAEWYILLHLPKLLKKRKEIQSNIKVSEDYIIENVVPKKITLFGLYKKGI